MPTSWQVQTPSSKTFYAPQSWSCETDYQGEYYKNDFTTVARKAEKT